MVITFQTLPFLQSIPQILLLGAKPRATFVALSKLTPSASPTRACTPGSSWTLRRSKKMLWNSLGSSGPCSSPDSTRPFKFSGVWKHLLTSYVKWRLEFELDFFLFLGFGWFQIEVLLCFFHRAQPAQERCDRCGELDRCLLCG